MARQRMRRRVRKFAKAALGAASSPEERAVARAMLRCNTLEEAQALAAPAPAPEPAPEPEPVPEPAPEPKVKSKAKAKKAAPKSKE